MRWRLRSWVNVPQSANRYGLVMITVAIAIPPAKTSHFSASRQPSGDRNAAAISANTIAPSEYLNDAASPTQAPPASNARCEPVRSTTALAHRASAQGRIPGPSFSASRE